MIRLAASALLALALGACASMEEAPQPVAEPQPAPAIETVAEPALEAAQSAPDTAVQMQAAAPLRYVVQKGDTLWDLSKKFLRDSWQWPELWYANPDVENPHLIFPGDVLYLTWAEGKPRLSREPPPAEMVKGPTDDFGPRVRELPLDQAIHSIPLDAIRAFLRGPRLISRDELNEAPYVLAFDDERIIGGAGTVSYVLGIEDRRTTKYQIVRKGEEYRDPDDNQVIGYEALPVAESEVRAFGDPSTVYLIRSTMEARIGDQLLPGDEHAFPSRFIPHAPKHRVNGRIISVYNGVSQIGQYQVVAINRGAEIGLEPGHVLAVIQTGRKAKDPQSFFGSKVRLPEVTAGTAMVFKVAPRVSYALILSAVRQIHLLDAVETPDPSAR